MTKTKLSKEVLQTALDEIGAENLYELRCEHCGRFHGFYSLQNMGNGIILFCKSCKGYTLKRGYKPCEIE